MSASHSPHPTPPPRATFVSAGVNLTFSYAAGEAASRFLVALRDEQKIYGVRCPECRRVLVPARSFCPRCFVGTTEWLAVGPQGVVTAVAPRTPPSAHSALEVGETSSQSSSFIPHPDRGLSFPSTEGPGQSLALIRLDGADTALVHRLGDTDPRDLCLGLRVTAVFAETRTGSILDIAHFAPIHLPAIEDRRH